MNKESLGSPAEAPQQQLSDEEKIKKLEDAIKATRARIIQKDVDVMKETGVFKNEHTKNKIAVGELPEYLDSAVLTDLEITQNIITYNEVGAFAGFLKCCTKLARLSLLYNDMSEDDIAKIADALKDHNLQTLEISGNYGVGCFADIIKNSKTLVTLRLSDCNILEDTALIIAKAILRNSIFGLEELNMAHNGLCIDGARYFGEVIRLHTGLKIMDLSFNLIGDTGAEAIANGLLKARSLEKLFLTDNNIGKRGCTAIANALKTNKTLIELHLDNNEIGDEAAEEIADALTVNTTLVTLSLIGNDIGDKGIAAIAKALEGNKSLTNLDLRNNEKKL